MKEHIAKAISEAIEAKKKLNGMESEIEGMAKIIVECFRNNGKVILCGNGGSAADAQHIAAEFIGLLEASKKRPGMHAVALTTNTSILTALSNDFGYEQIFARQIEGVADKGDVVIGITTSGNSANIIKALNAAKEKGAKTIGWTGSKGGKLNGEKLDFLFKAPSDNVNRIQELHITVGHILCSAVEKELHP